MKVRLGISTSVAVAMVVIVLVIGGAVAYYFVAEPNLSNNQTGYNQRVTESQTDYLSMNCSDLRAMINDDLNHSLYDGYWGNRGPNGWYQLAQALIQIFQLKQCKV